VSSPFVESQVAKQIEVFGEPESDIWRNYSVWKSMYFREIECFWRDVRSGCANGSC